MSKGLGTRQRLILEKVEELKAFYLSDILPPNYQPKDYQTMYRAAMTLHEAGKVAIDRHMMGAIQHRSRQGCGNCGLKLLIHHVGTRIEHPMHFGEQFKCITGNIVTPIQHLGRLPTKEEVEKRFPVLLNRGADNGRG